MRLLDDPDLAGRLGDAARVAAQAYTPDAYAGALIAIYQGVLAAPAARPRG
jgi:glycosyltransferase involved in cell wall biosynthesis